MATYLGTHGSKIQNYTTNPDNPNQGEVWYNETANTIRFEGATTAGSWSTGGNLGTARRQMAGAGTSSSAALGFGGYLAPGASSAPSALCESYNGTSWTEVGDLNTARRGLMGSGTQTSALAYGGNAPPTSAKTNSWNGSSWTEVNDLSTARQQGGSAGVDNTSALASGGFTPPSTYQTVVEQWNGTNWAEDGDLNNARVAIRGSGTTTSALAF
jgi:hypothetical protein